MRPFTVFKYLFFIFLPLSLGAGLSFLALDGFGDLTKNFSLTLASKVFYHQSEAGATTTIKKITYLDLAGEKIPTTGKFISADLSAKRLSLYQDGQRLAAYPIITIGRPGTAWETPRGLFKVETKEINHFSSIGQVYMPYSMQINGNYFIHGWTYYPGGRPVSAEFSGGCLKLATADAKQIYDWADIGTSVFIFDNNEQQKNLGHYQRQETAELPAVSATAYLIADLDSGEILSANNRLGVLPIDGVARLMSSLVVLDSINFFNQTQVKLQKNDEISSATLLLPGEKFTIKDLLYPLLFGDNQVAATNVAKIIGRDYFISKMNKRAVAIGLDDTVFTDPAGQAYDNVSTVTDLFKLTRHIYLYKNFIFQLTALAKYKVGWHEWLNQSNLLDTPGFLGGLIGRIDDDNEAGVLIIKKEESGKIARRIVITVLGSQNASDDLKKLSAEVRNNFQYQLNDQINQKPEQPTAVLPVSSNLSPDDAITTLAFVGDIMLDRGVKQSVIKNGVGDYNWLFTDIAKIKEADILMGNLEGPVSDKGKNVGSAYSFRMDPAVIPVLRNQGFDILSVANNHAGDWGAQAFADTLSQFSNSSITLIGGGSSKDIAMEPKIMEKNGVKFGFLSFSDVGPNWLLAGTSTAGILSASNNRRTEIIKQAAGKCDVLIVSFHFGTEYEKQSNQRQKTLAHEVVEAGAKIVVGIHPHVVQEMENYRGGVIFYSLGNFIFDQYFSVDTMTGLAAKISFKGKEIFQVEKLETILDKQYRVSVK